MISLQPNFHFIAGPIIQENSDEYSPYLCRRYLTNRPEFCSEDFKFLSSSDTTCIRKSTLFCHHLKRCIRLPQRKTPLFINIFSAFDEHEYSIVTEICICFQQYFLKSNQLNFHFYSKVVQRYQILSTDSRHEMNFGCQRKVLLAS